MTPQQADVAETAATLLLALVQIIKTALEVADNLAKRRQPPPSSDVEVSKIE